MPFAFFFSDSVHMSHLHLILPDKTNTVRATQYYVDNDAFNRFFIRLVDLIKVTKCCAVPFFCLGVIDRARIVLDLELSLKDNICGKVAGLKVCLGVTPYRSLNN